MRRFRDGLRLACALGAASLLWLGSLGAQQKSIDDFLPRLHDGMDSP